MNYKINKIDDKHFFAGLLNTAQDNFDLAIDELERRINTKQNSRKGIIIYAFDETKRPQYELERNFKYLSEHLIFLQKLPEYYSELKDYYKQVKNILIELYESINNLRNYYTHYNHERVNIPSTVTNLLDFILFKNAVITLKGRAKNDFVKQSLITNYSKDFDNYFNKHNEWIDNDDKLTEEEKDLKKVKGKDKENFVINRMFRMFIYDKGKDFKLSDNLKSYNKELTTSGLIQLLALFLDKKQMNILFDNIKYVKSEYELQKKLARWVYTNSSYKTPRRLYKSDYNQDALLLQMANDLNKAPKDLYPYLSDKMKKEFLEDINIYLQENPGNFTDVSLVSHEVIRKRYEDKFTYFAIRFLDDVIKFPNLRFQVKVGKFVHDVREKPHKATDKTTTRIVAENISVFERLTKVTEAKKAYIEKLVGYTMGWEEFPHPKYQMYGNSIPIWLPDNTLGKQIDAVRKNNKPTKQELLKELNLSDAYKSPVAYLSIYELPALLYELLVKKKTPAEIEKILKDQINKQRKEILLQKEKLNNKKDENELEYVINEKIIKKLIKLQNKNAYDWKKIIKFLKTEFRVNPLGDIRKNYKRKPKNEKVLSLSEKGKIATWLSNDIKRFTDKEIRKEWKGHQFSEFQALLSYYEHKNGLLEKFMFNNKIVGSSRKKDLGINRKKFPFKGFDFSQKTLIGFYQKYLEARKAYIGKLLSIAEKKDDTQIDQFIGLFSANRIKIDETANDFLLKKMQMPYMLQRGIFDDKPTVYKRGKKVPLADWHVASSAMSNAQEYYAYIREYPTKIDKKGKVQFTVKIDPQKALKRQYNRFTDKKLQKFIYKNEIRIRRTMRNDYFILQMIKYFFNNSTEIDGETLKEISLKDFYLTKKEKLAKKTSQIDNVVFDQSFILKKRVKLSMYENKIQEEVSLKDAGKYKKMFHDQKVKMLVQYFPDKVWNIETVENELNDYEQIRSKIFFKQIHKIEKKIFLKAQSENSDIELLQNENPNFKKYISYYLLNNHEDKDWLNNADIPKTHFRDVKEELQKPFILVSIRNKFAHNQLISPNIFKYLKENYPMKNAERVATYLNRVFGIIFGDLMQDVY